MNVRRSPLIPAVLTAAFALVLIPDASAQNGNTNEDDNALVYSPDERVLGRSYAEWSAEWWEWVFVTPGSINPIFDPDGHNCHVNQSRPVFFLAGNNTPAPTVTRRCTVARNTVMFLPMINTECSNVEPDPYHGSTDATRLACAQAWIDGAPPATIKLSIDGHAVHGLRDFRVASPPFNFQTPPHDNILGIDGVTSGRSESDGYWAMLKPLKPGTHTIHFEGQVTVPPPFPGATPFSQVVTYHITVQ